MTAADPDKEWKEYRFDIIHLSRLCHHLFDKADADKKKSIEKGGKGLDKTWRCKMFDRVLTRFWQRWLISREWSIRGFWQEFGEEEYEEDVLAHDWVRWAYKGHNGFTLTKDEVVNGVSQQQFLVGLIKRPDGVWRWDLNAPPLTPTATQADIASGTTSISNSYSNNTSASSPAASINLPIVKPPGPTTTTVVAAVEGGDKPTNTPVIAEPTQIGSTINTALGIKKELIESNGSPKAAEVSPTTVVVAELEQAVFKASTSATATSSKDVTTTEPTQVSVTVQPPSVGEKRPREDDEEESSVKRVRQSAVAEKSNWASTLRKKIGLGESNLGENSEGPIPLSREVEKIVDAALQLSTPISDRVQVFPSLQQALAASNPTTQPKIMDGPNLPQVHESSTRPNQNTLSAGTSETPSNLAPPLVPASTHVPPIPKATNSQPMSLETSPVTTMSRSVSHDDKPAEDMEKSVYDRDLIREYEEILRASQLDNQTEPLASPAVARRPMPNPISTHLIPPPKAPTTSKSSSTSSVNSSTSVITSSTKATSTSSREEVLDSLLSDPRPIKRLHAIFLLRDLSWYLGSNLPEGQQLELSDRIRYSQTWSVPAVRLPSGEDLFIDLEEARDVVENVCLFLQGHLAQKLYTAGELEGRLDRELKSLNVVPMFSKQEVGIQAERQERSMTEKEVDASQPVRLLVDVESMTSALGGTAGVGVQTDSPEEEDEGMDLDRSSSGSQSQTPPLSSDATMVDLSTSIPRMEKTLKTELRSTVTDGRPSPTMVMHSVMRNVADILESQRGGASGSSKVVPYDSPLVRVLLDEVKSMKEELRSNQQRNQEEMEALTELYRAEIDSLKSDLKSREDRYRREVEVTRQRHHQELDDVRETIREIERDREKAEEEARFSVSELLEMRRRVTLLEGRHRVRSPSVSGSYSQGWADPIPGMDISVARRPSYHPLGHLLSQEEVSLNQQPPGSSIPSTPVAQDLDRSAGRQDDDAPPLPIKSQRKFHAVHRLSTC